MARNAIESDFRSSKLAQIGLPKWPPAVTFFFKISCVFIWHGEKCIRTWFSVIQNGRRQPFCEKKIKIKIAYWSEMARNVIESDFRSSKMAAGSILWKKKSKLCIDLKWREMWSKVIFGHPKWPPAAILWKKKAYWSENARNAIESDFRQSKMAARSHFVKKKKLRIDLKWREIWSKMITMSSL